MTSSSSHHPESSSASSTPRAGAGNNHHPPPLPPAPAPAPPPAQAHGGPQVRLMCSFGGRILPRPGDRQLRYVGGETRIVAVPRAAASYAALVAALAKVAPALYAPGAARPALKYQLPQDDLDSLISVSSSDDVDHLMDELDRIHDLAANVAKPPRVRVFLFAPEPHAGAFGSVLSGTGGEASTDQWFVDALNAPAPHPIERGRSEASSILSEAPDYLFGLDTASDEPSPGTAAARSKSDSETPHHGDNNDDAPAPTPGAHQAPYVSEGSSWPAPPPPYMAQPMYYFPMPPVHYLDPSAQGGSYMPRPVYHVGGGGSDAPGDLHATGGMAGAYGVPHHMQPFPPMMYAPPRAVVYTSEGKPAAEGGAQSS